MVKLPNDNLKVLMRSGKLRSQETRSRQCGLHFIIGVAKFRTHSILIFLLSIFGFLNFVWDVWKSYFSMCKVPRRLSFCANLAFWGPWVLGLGFLKSWKLGQNGHERILLPPNLHFCLHVSYDHFFHHYVNWWCYTTTRFFVHLFHLSVCTKGNFLKFWFWLRD
jgi:hypothetical protein